MVAGHCQDFCTVSSSPPAPAPAPAVATATALLPHHPNSSASASASTSVLSSFEADEEGEEEEDGAPGGFLRSEPPPPPPPPPRFLIQVGRRASALSASTAAEDVTDKREREQQEAEAEGEEEEEEDRGHGGGERRRRRGRGTEGGGGGRSREGKCQVQQPQQPAFGSFVTASVSSAVSSAVPPPPPLLFPVGPPPPVIRWGRTAMEGSSQDLAAPAVEEAATAGGKEVPKHPWQDPDASALAANAMAAVRHHAALAQKLSLPAELGKGGAGAGGLDWPPSFLVHQPPPDTVVHAAAAVSPVGAPPFASSVSSSSLVPGAGGGALQQHGGGGLGSHLPITRTVSDSYSQQQNRRSKEMFAASRRKLESEDSSYDSDHDGGGLGGGGHDALQLQLSSGGGGPLPLHHYPQQHQQPFHHLSQQHVSSHAGAGAGAMGLKLPFVQISRSHDDVSRTPSETLAAEFEEYVTLRKPQQQGQQQQHLRRSRDNSPGVASSDEQQNLDSLIRDPSYNGKVEFALRLGYSEGLLQRALLKLGHAAGENQLLEELIRLQNSSPAAAAGSSGAPAAASAAEPSEDQVVDEGALLSRRASDAEGLLRLPSSGRAAAAASGPKGGGRSHLAGVSSLPETEKELLPVVIDGSNVAMSHGNKDVFSCKGIRICVKWFQARGHKDITVFVPKWRKESSKPDTPISDQHLLTELEKERLLFFTPSRQFRGRRLVCHDDRYILNLAAETGAVVVSNDNYRDLINDKEGFKKVIEEKILMYSFVNDRFMPPDDPLGRNGPTLDQFLRRRRPGHLAGGHGAGGNQQPCPYGKKCTYGNKCKFFHAERGNQPQKSITEKLKEHSSQMISEVRARGSSRDSSPGTDQLMRTMSAQPLQRKERPGEPGNLFAAEKQALCRTRSTFPRLNAGGGDHQLPLAQHPPPPSHLGGAVGGGGYWHKSPAGAQQQGAAMLGPEAPPAVWQGQFRLGVSLSSAPPPPAGVPPPIIAQQMQQQQNEASQRHLPPTSLPDTSLPPPPPRSPWSGTPGAGAAPATTPAAAAAVGAPEQASNAHRKLARQLTLNPSYDPRIHQHRGGANPPPVRHSASVTAAVPPPPPFPFPPPTSVPPPPPPTGQPPPPVPTQPFSAAPGTRPVSPHSAAAAAAAVTAAAAVAADQHAVVTRNASAPERASSAKVTTAAAAANQGLAMNPLLDPQSNPGLAPPPPHQMSGGGVEGPPPQFSSSSSFHSHLQRMSSTSDSHLHKTLSDTVSVASSSWRPQQEQHQLEPHNPIVVAAAVSPLISASPEASVWETSKDVSSEDSSAGGCPGGGGGSGGDQQARSKLYYHLAAVFPEEQVLVAMRALPEETDPQKICSYILKLSQQQQQQQQHQ